MIGPDYNGGIVHRFTPFVYAPSFHVLRNAFISYLYQRSTASKKALGFIIQSRSIKKSHWQTGCQWL
jgi:hypothetical protein